MTDEKGIIKFNCKWIRKAPLKKELIKELNFWRDKMYRKKLIGVYANRIGYGNISIRHKKDQFIISGSATGKHKKLSARHYTTATSFNLAKNSLTAEGPIVASSESLTHAVIYKYDKKINAVIHVHDKRLWKKLFTKVPATKKNIEYGTPAMAKEMVRLFRETDLARKKILVMKGHKEGIIAFGKDLAEAGEVILNALR